MSNTPEWAREPFNGLITRAEWSKGKSKIGRLGRPLQLPIEHVVIHHTVTPATSDPIADMWKVNDIGVQRFGMHSYNYNFWPDQDGHMHRVLQGQGGLKGAHAGAAWNARSLGLSWIGNFERNVPGHSTLVVTASMLHYMAAWVGYLIDNGVVSPHVRVHAHNQLKATACPGDFWDSEIARLQELINLGYRMTSYNRDFIVASVPPTPPVAPTPLPTPEKVAPSTAADVEEAKTRFSELENRVNALDEQVKENTHNVEAHDNAITKLQDQLIVTDDRARDVQTVAQELHRRMGLVEDHQAQDADAMMSEVARRLLNDNQGEQ